MVTISAENFTRPPARCAERLPDAEHPLSDVDDLVVDGLNSYSIADQRQDLLSDELHHRVQNTLAIVLALARLTARSCKTIDEFQVAFGDRVQAMARTNALLLRGRPRAVDVRAAIELELEPYANLGGQVTLECEDLILPPDAALSLSLLVHELATNAAKYGGLSTPGGSLQVRCERCPTGGLLTWRETLPGLVPHGTMDGSGSMLIKRLAHDLGGAAALHLRSGGFHADITFELKSGPAIIV